MFTAGSDLGHKTPEEIFYTDFKTFKVDKITMGIGQITSMSAEELEQIGERMKPFIEKASETHGLTMAFFMLTDIINESTTMLCYGPRAAVLVEAAFGVKVEGNVARMPSVVSRKKQVVPALIAELSRENEV